MFQNIFEGGRVEVSTIGKPILKCLCPDYIPAPDYVSGKPKNCFTCDYGTGTKCEDMHAALAEMEKKHNAYSHMLNHTNRGVEHY